MLTIKPKVGIDVDDVLLSCNAYACEKANEKHNIVPPITIDEITSWSYRSPRTDYRFDYYCDPEFFRTQPIIPGAQEFIRKLVEIADVYIITAIDPRCMTIRIERIMRDFPEIPKENIIMGYQKDLIHVDFLLDDSPMNIMNSSAKFPVIFRRPWNASLNGFLSVTGYDEFLSLVKSVYNAKEIGEKKFVILYGPSGSGKTEIMKASGLPIVGSVTTREPRAGDVGYTYVKSEEEFFSYDLLEYSNYAGNYYGTGRDAVDAQSKCIKAMDLDGAIRARVKYPDAVLVFVKRPKDEILASIIERDVSTEEKVKRISSLDQEFANERFADYVLENNGTLEEAVHQLLSYLD